MKIEALKWGEPNYLTSLYTNIMILARLKGEEKAIAKLNHINTHCADLWDEKGENKEAMSLGALQSHYLWLLGNSMKGNLKIEPIILEVEIELKLIYYKLIEDMDLDMFKTGVNLDKKTVI